MLFIAQRPPPRHINRYDTSSAYVICTCLLRGLRRVMSLLPLLLFVVIIVTMAPTLLVIRGQYALRSFPGKRTPLIILRSKGGRQSTGNFPLCNTGMEKVWKAVLPYVPCDGDWLSGRVTANQEAVCCVCGNRPGGGGRGRGDSGFQGVLRNRAKKAPEVFTAPAHHSSSVLLLNSHSFFLRLGGAHVPQLRNRIVTLNVGTRASASKSSNCPMSLFLWCAVGGWSRDSSFENDEQTSRSAIIHKDNRWITSLISCVFSIVRLRAFSDEMRVRVSQKHAAIELRCFFCELRFTFLKSNVIRLLSPGWAR